MKNCENPNKHISKAEERKRNNRNAAKALRAKKKNLADASAAALQKIAKALQLNADTKTFQTAEGVNTIAPKILEKIKALKNEQNKPRNKVMTPDTSPEASPEASHALPLAQEPIPFDTYHSFADLPAPVPSPEELSRMAFALAACNESDENPFLFWNEQAQQSESSSDSHSSGLPYP